MTKIIQRHDTAANWTSINPVLAAGEMGVETDTNKFKFGDGTTAWSDLAYAAGEGGSGTTITSSDGTTTYSELELGDSLTLTPKEIPWSNPQMSSNSQDGYVLTSSSNNTSDGKSNMYKAFNKDTTTADDCWYTGSVSMPQWIMLECPEPVRLTSCMIVNENKTPVNFKSGYIQGSNDGNTFDTLYTITDRPNTTGLQETYAFDNNTYYKYLRVYCTASHGSGLSIQEIEFSGFVKDKTGLTTLNVDAYTKTETDNLLSTKQDKLTAKLPLKIAPETYKELNVKVVSGNISEECVYSQSLNSIYGPGLQGIVEIPFATANTWEIVIRTYFNGGNSLIYSTTQYAGFYFGRYSNGNECLFHISTNGTSWNHSATFSYSSFYKKDVYIKIEYTGSAYIASYSNDGITFTRLYTHNLSTKLTSNTAISLAQWSSSKDYYSGNIYLTDSYYKINGVKYPLAVIEKGALTISNNPASTSSLGVVQPDGTSITVSDTGVISGQDVKTFTGYSDTGTLVLKSINGVLQWVAE